MPRRPQVRELAESPSTWAIPWLCLHEFLAIVTYPCASYCRGPAMGCELAG